MLLKIKEQNIELLPQKAVYWKEQETLIVSDLHFGKSSTFRKAGIPIPEGAMQDDLDVLLEVVKNKKAKRCIIAGDLLHHRTGLTIHTIEIIGNWLKSFPCTVELVLGNHDKALELIPYRQWNLRVYHQLLVPPFAFSHVPCEIENFFTWSGHIHPKVYLNVSGKPTYLLCFIIEKNCGILPAFSSFAGGKVMSKSKDTTLYVIVGNEVLKL